MSALALKSNPDDSRGYLVALACLLGSVPTALLLVAIAIAALLLSSCTVVSGNAKGSYTYASLGGDQKEIVQSSTGWGAAEVKNSTAFQDVAKTVRWGLVAAATQGIASDAFGAWKGVTAAREATKTASIRSAADVSKARLAADVTKTQLATEAAVPAAAP